MMEPRTIRVVRDSQGLVLIRWAEHWFASDKCSECGANIAPREEFAIYDDEYVRDPGEPHGHRRRKYCKSCGEDLESSLTTTGE